MRRAIRSALYATAKRSSPEMSSPQKGKRRVLTRVQDIDLPRHDSGGFDRGDVHRAKALPPTSGSSVGVGRGSPSRPQVR